ncbi:Corticotropin-releasing factor receptor 2 [Aphelenchoides fujianensis]|nr:Corticotropin-releasing factor receptor 2 [Aphelenchoides fujianensis]
MSLTLRENATCNILSEHHAAYFSYSNKCAPHFDRSLCWYNVSFGDIGYRDCPFTFCTSKNTARVECARRRERGTRPSTISVLEILENHQHCISGFCRTCPDVLRETVINVSLALSVISVGLLVAALVLFSLFDSIQCRRLSIHKNLALAFVFRFTVLALWTVTNTSNLFRDCSQYTPMPLKGLENLCKVILWLVIYFQVASVMWMLIEGIYLYSRFTVFAMRYGEGPYYVYLLSGWGFPFVVVMIWTGVHEYHSNANHLYCWLPYAQGFHLWILAGTMGAALLLNVVVLLAIIVILVQKLRTDSSAESKKIWKTVKATILLVPLLGVSNIPLFYEPDKPSAIYMLGSAILQHSQRTYVPDTALMNQRHGVPMEELNPPAAPPQTAAGSPTKKNAQSTNESSSSTSSPQNSMRTGDGEQLCNEHPIVQF